MRSLFSALALLALTGPVSGHLIAQTYGQTDPELALRLKAAVVRLEAIAEDTSADVLESRGFEVGIVVSPGHVLTNAKGVTLRDVVVAVFFDGRRLPAR